MSKPKNVQNVIDHLGHVDYPITGEKFSAACDNMSDVSEEEKKWVKSTIDMDKTYMSAEDIKKALMI